MIENKDLKIALADERIMLLKSDNICIGGGLVSAAGKEGYEQQK